MIKLIHCDKCKFSDLRSYGIRICELRHESVFDDDTCLIREAKIRAWYGRCDRLENYSFPDKKILEEGREC